MTVGLFVTDAGLAHSRFVVFNNLSLQYNSVGFYQLMKVLTTPVVVLLQVPPPAAFTGASRYF
jgi:hypothetical protein